MGPMLGAPLPKLLIDPQFISTRDRGKNICYRPLRLFMLRVSAESGWVTRSMLTNSTGMMQVPIARHSAATPIRPNLKASYLRSQACVVVPAPQPAASASLSASARQRYVFAIFKVTVIIP